MSTYFYAGRSNGGVYLEVAFRENNGRIHWKVDADVLTHCPCCRKFYFPIDVVAHDEYGREYTFAELTEELGFIPHNWRKVLMLQKIKSAHHLDKDGNPAGGETCGQGISIQWQNGPLGRGVDRKEPNGAFVEGVIAAAIDRLVFYQTANGEKFRCRENSLAITKLEEALLWLQKRTMDREARQVEGTHTA